MYAEWCAVRASLSLRNSNGERRVLEVTICKGGLLASLSPSRLSVPKVRTASCHRSRAFNIAFYCTVFPSIMVAWARGGGMLSGVMSWRDTDLSDQIKVGRTNTLMSLWFYLTLHTGAKGRGGAETLPSLGKYFCRPNPPPIFLPISLS